MNDDRTICTLEIEPSSELSTLAENLRKVLGVDHQIHQSESASFHGSVVYEIVLILGSSGAISAAAKVIIAWLDAGKNRVIKINKNEFKGYSVDDAVRLIQAASNDRSLSRGPQLRRIDDTALLLPSAQSIFANSNLTTDRVRRFKSSVHSILCSIKTIDFERAEFHNKTKTRHADDAMRLRAAPWRRPRLLCRALPPTCGPYWHSWLPNRIRARRRSTSPHHRLSCCSA
jgi:hypothetical protein